jgi:undecaprenyl phosphate-alpha-L-ara4FN deformylase
MIFSIKIDVDTERGTRFGVPNLIALLTELKIPATFLFSLGPDNTGRAIQRIFRRGFLKKVSRTSVISTYGLRTLLNGVLLPGPHIGKRHAAVMRAARDAGFEVGIHAYDHQRWQDGVCYKLSAEQIATEFTKACSEFKRIFGTTAATAGAPGWQANSKTLAAYDAAALTYASDCRGAYPFFPRIDNQTFHTLQIPTTLPTLDELLGRPEFYIGNLTEHYIAMLNSDDNHPNVITIHAELEGMKYLEWFSSFLLALKAHGDNGRTDANAGAGCGSGSNSGSNIQFQTLHDIAQKYLLNEKKAPVCDLVQGEVEGRSGQLALQKIN